MIVREAIGIERAYRMLRVRPDHAPMGNGLVFAKLRDRPITEITRADVRALLKRARR